jgi:ribonuclease III
MLPVDSAPLGTPEELEARLDVRLSDRALLPLALTHKSAVNEGLAVHGHNERLEFLGDSVLGAVVSDLLFTAFPDASEGALTQMRAELVRQSGLAGWARQFDLARYIVLGRGEEERGGRDRDSLISSAFEAIVGALYCDQGFAAVQQLIQPLVEAALPGLSPSQRPRDAKSELQYQSQARWGVLPVYRVRHLGGPEHRRVFTVEVETQDGTKATGVGPSRQAAEQEAARRALDLLESVSPC